MGMFDDLIPRAQAPAPSLPADPKGTAAMPGGRVRSTGLGYGLGRSMPEGSAPSRLVEEPRGPSVNARPFPPIDFPVPSDVLAGAPSAMTSQDRAGLQSRLRGAVNGVEGAPDLSTLFTAVMGGLENGQFDTSLDAERYATDRTNWIEETTPEVTNLPGTMLSRLFGMDDGVPDAVGEVPTGRITLRPPETASAVPTPSAQGDAAGILDQARQAIANGKDPAAVAGRLREMGIDPANL